MSAGATPTVAGLGEIALRSRDAPRLARFYGDVLGFEEYAAFDGVIFLSVAPGAPGHPQLLAIFDVDWPSTREDHGWAGLRPDQSPLHHFALSVALEAVSAWEARLTDAGVPFNRRVFDWIGWRSLFFQDLDGNVVELVAVDPSVRARPSETA